MINDLILIDDLYQIVFNLFILFPQFAGAVYSGSWNEKVYARSAKHTYTTPNYIGV